MTKPIQHLVVFLPSKRAELQPLLLEYLDARGIGEPQRTIEAQAYAMMNVIGLNYYARRGRAISRNRRIIDAAKENGADDTIIDGLWQQLFGDNYLDRFSRPSFLIGLNIDPRKKAHRIHIGKGRYAMWRDHRNIRDLDLAALNDKASSDAEYLMGLGRSSGRRTLEEVMERLAYKDGALLIRPDGRVYSSRTHLIKLDPSVLSQQPMHSEQDRRYGFKTSADTRHYAALCASAHLFGSVFYTLSQETGHVRRFESGAITFTTVEPRAALERLSQLG